jgi:YHS domain-containing protein
VPACAGNDPVVEADQTRPVPGTLDHSALWNGRLYLFSSAATLARFRTAPGRYADAAP